LEHQACAQCRDVAVTAFGHLVGAQHFPAGRLQ
jgi:hypothetical protein